MCVSSHRCATGDTQLTVFSCYGKIFRKKSRNIKCTGQSQKIIWVTVINMDLKSKDKLIRVGSFLFLFFSSLEFKVSLAHKIGSSNPWCLVLKKTLLLIIDAVRIFPTLPTSTVLLERAAGFIFSFVADFRKFISFCRLGSIFTQIIAKKIKPINKLLILSFSLSQIALFACKKNGFEMNFGNKYVIKWVDVRPKNRS